MAKVSMLEASRLFKVSRPTLLDHLKKGKITGEKVVVDKNTFWKLDPAELARVYKRRDDPAPAAPATLEATSQLPAWKETELQGEIKVLQAELKSARDMIEEKDKRIEDRARAA